jgi:MYXO-CTERM domain-containing protein
VSTGTPPPQSDSGMGCALAPHAAVPSVGGWMLLLAAAALSLRRRARRPPTR